ncbi:MAG: nucleoside transporter C-terminal domain-containing protein [Hyphomicrobiaceae bacterium]|jgi:CNT family concentrative nucleoside transporter
MELALQSLLGVVAIPLLAFAICEDRSALDRRRLLVTILAGLGLQFTIALLLLKLPGSRTIFDAVGAVVTALQAATGEGMRMVFGYLAGGPTPFDSPRPAAQFILAFQALPLILVISALARLLYHWGVLQRVVGLFATLLRKSFGIGGPLGTVAAAKIFLGMVEAPLLVKPYLREMGRGALFAAMTVGMATVAGTVMALYATILEPVLPGAAGHVLAASLMNAPGALMLARLAVPAGFEGGPIAATIRLDNPPRSAMDAIAQGTIDGLKLLASVVAMLIVMVALVALANSLIGFLTSPLGTPITLQQILGWICTPLALLIGVPLSEATLAGSFIGQKIVLNEFLAYLDLARLEPHALSPRSRLLLTYALCGFANLGSLGIMIGGLTAMVPERRDEIIELAPKSVVVGLLATLLSAAIVGTIVWH